MKAESQIVIALDRGFNDTDEKAITLLRVKWLVYNVTVLQKSTSAEIKLFHSQGAKSDLLKELGVLYPGEHLTEM